jgi:hypothetical protein
MIFRRVPLRNHDLLRSREHGNEIRPRLACSAHERGTNQDDKGQQSGIRDSSHGFQNQAVVGETVYLRILRT